jgi:hypothetical protein
MHLKMCYIDRGRSDHESTSDHEQHIMRHCKQSRTSRGNELRHGGIKQQQTSCMIALNGNMVIHTKLQGMLH